MQPPVPTPPQLSEENLRELTAARTALRKINRAISVARFDGWTIGIFAALTFLLGITELTSIVLGLGLGVIAFVELAGATRLRRLDPQAARMLGLNQLALACMLIIYAVCRIHVELSGHGEFAAAAASDAALGQALQPYENLVRQLTMLFYGGLMAIAVFGQGGMALFYFKRRKHLQAYLDKTPAWIIAMQKAGVSL